MLGWNNSTAGVDTIGYASNNQGNRAYQLDTGGSGEQAIENSGTGNGGNLQPYSVGKYVIKV